MSTQDALRPAYPPVRKVTTSVTPVAVFERAVRTGNACTVRFLIQGIRRSTGVANFFERVIRVHNPAGTPIVVSNNAPIPDDAPTGYSINVDATSPGFRVSVVGGGHSVDWSSQLAEIAE